MIMLYILPSSAAVINHISEMDCDPMSSCTWQEIYAGQTNACEGICRFDLPNPTIKTWTFLNDAKLDCGNNPRRVVMCESALQVILTAGNTFGSDWIDDVPNSASSTPSREVNCNSNLDQNVMNSWENRSEIPDAEAADEICLFDVINQESWTLMRDINCGTSKRVVMCESQYKFLKKACERNNCGKSWGNRRKKRESPLMDLINSQINRHP